MKKSRLNRHTELEAGPPPARKTGLTRTRFRAGAPIHPLEDARPFSSGPTKPRKSMAPDERSAKKIVRARANGWCESRIPGVCFGRATNFHHRKRQSQGGAWSPSNGLAVCGSGSTGCHGALTNTNGRADEFAANGWIVSAYSDPASVSVLIAARWVLLTDDGRYQPIPEREAS